jgi:glycine cleavage system H protein
MKRYSVEHEWLEKIGVTEETMAPIVKIGITNYAQSELGDIVYIDSIVTEGEILEAEESIASIEAVKTVSDLYAPVKCKLIEFNTEIESNPEIINEDAEGKGWIAKIEITYEDFESLMTEEDYKKMLES